MRIGDVYEGPSGGRREIVAYEWNRDEEALAWEMGAPNPMWREVIVLQGHSKRRVCMWGEARRWFDTATRITEGTGNGPPWDWNASLDGDRWTHPDGRVFEHVAWSIWRLNGVRPHHGEGHPSTFAEIVAAP